MSSQKWLVTCWKVQKLNLRPVTTHAPCLLMRYLSSQTVCCLSCPTIKVWQEHFGLHCCGLSEGKTAEINLLLMTKFNVAEFNLWSGRVELCSTSSVGCGTKKTASALWFGPLRSWSFSLYPIGAFSNFLSVFLLRTYNHKLFWESFSRRLCYMTAVGCVNPFM